MSIRNFIILGFLLVCVSNILLAVHVLWLYSEHYQIHRQMSQTLEIAKQDILKSVQKRGAPSEYSSLSLTRTTQQKGVYDISTTPNHTNTHRRKVTKNPTENTSPPEKVNIRDHKAKQNSKIYAKRRNVPKSILKTIAQQSACRRCLQTEYPVLTDQPALCTVKGNSSIDVVFLIDSTVTHLAHRNAIRNTWASVTRNNTSNFRHVFMFGTVSKASQTRALQKEGQKFHDVIVFGFQDSYMNLTLKTISALRWFSKRCRQARFFIKTDDDVWINTPVVLSMLNKNHKVLQHGLGGQCSSKVKVERSPKVKWYVPPQVYPHKLYPGYCRGLAYAGSLNVAERVEAMSKDTPFFHLEDVYVGMCLKKLGYGVNVLHPEFDRKVSNDTCQGFSPSVATVYDVTPDWMLGLWKANCSKSPTRPT